MQNDLLIILKLYLVTLVWQVGFWPVVRRLFKDSADQGWAVTRIFFSLFVSLVVWQLGNIGIAVNQSNWILIITVTILLLGWRAREKESLPRQLWKLILLEEYLFLVGLFGESLVRGYLPNIDSLEKFMDYGFVRRYLESPTLPAMDMWQAGKNINYYSFGHFYTSVLVRMWGVGLDYGYNLMLGFLAGMSAMLSFAVIKKISGGTFFAVLGSFLIVLGGNGHTLWYLISNNGLLNYWYADATRFIHNTIHEFPGYSFIVADLHGHLIDLPIVLVFLYLIVDWVSRRRVIVEVLMGVLLGVMMMTNTWDMAIYGLLLLVAGMAIWITKKRDLLSLLRSAVIVLTSTALTAGLWWLGFEPISSGVHLVKSRSPLWQLGVLWSLGLVVNGLVLAFYKGGNRLIVLSVSLLSFLLIVIPELIFVKDIYPDHPRANTMFKLTYQASILIGLLWGAVGSYFLDFGHKIGVWTRAMGVVVLLIIFGGSMIFPLLGFTTFYENFGSYRGLDGVSWIEKDFPAKMGAIKYLRNSGLQGNVLEAVGDSYTKFNMISVFSGRPTIQGWRVHEWLWRGGYSSVAERESQVREVYEGGDLEKSRSILNSYSVRWIMVGDDEVEMYKVNDEKIKQLGEIVWIYGENYLVEVK